MPNFAHTHRSRSRFWSLCIWLSAGSAALSPAAVLYVDRTAAPLSIPADLDGLYLNFVTGVTGNSETEVPGWDFNLYHLGTGLTFFTPAGPAGQGTLSSGPTALSLLEGETIGPAGMWQTGQALGTNFHVTGEGYVGVRFWNEATASLNYGWVVLQTTGGAGAGFPAAVTGYAYDNTGAAVAAGPIPEPSAAAMLVAGLSIFCGYRRRFPARTVRLGGAGFSGSVTGR